MDPTYEPEMHPANQRTVPDPMTGLSPTRSESGPANTPAMKKKPSCSVATSVTSLRDALNWAWIGIRKMPIAYTVPNVAKRARNLVGASVRRW